MSILGYKITKEKQEQDIKALKIAAKAANKELKEKHKKETKNAIKYLMKLSKEDPSRLKLILLELQKCINS